MGLVISHKSNEKRRALLPNDISKIQNPQQLFFEKGYGESVGFSDEDYAQYLRYHFYICEKAELLGMTNHLLFVGENK